MPVVLLSPMKSYTNTKKVKQKQKIAMVASLVGLVIMGVSLAISFRPAYSTPAWIAAFVGLAIASVGTYHVNRWVRPPLPEPFMEQTFKDRLDARHVLFNHFGVVPHLMLTPKGLIAIQVKRYEGPVSYDAQTKKWRGKVSIARLYGHGLTAEGLGDPSEELTRARNAVLAWLQRTVPEVADDVPVEAVAFFINPKTELNVAQAPIPIAQQGTLRKVVQGFFTKEKPLPKEVYNRLRSALEAEVSSGLVQAA